MIAAADFYYVADLGWMWLRWHFATMPSRSADVAVERLFALGGAGASSFVLATGPSARLVDPSSVSADVRIACNSVVRDLDLLRVFRPDVICFMDPVFHYGPSRSAPHERRLADRRQRRRVPPRHVPRARRRGRRRRACAGQHRGRAQPQLGGLSVSIRPPATYQAVAISSRARDPQTGSVQPVPAAVSKESS